MPRNLSWAQVTKILPWVFRKFLSQESLILGISKVLVTIWRKIWLFWVLTMCSIRSSLFSRKIQGFGEFTITSFPRNFFSSVHFWWNRHFLWFYEINLSRVHEQHAGFQVRNSSITVSLKFKDFVNFGLCLCNSGRYVLHTS